METNKIKNIINNTYVKYGLILLAGLLLGWLIFGDSSGKSNTEQTKNKTKVQIWTCAMHPQIKQNKPGKCPICGMDLIPLKTSGSSNESIDPNTIQLSKEAVVLANIQTIVIGHQQPEKDIQLYGTIQPDERLSQSQASHVSGRIEKLYVNFTGEIVKQGQIIASVYSPDLLNAQQELLEAVKMTSVQPALIQAAHEKLRLLKMTDDQIMKIEQSGKVSPYIDINSDVSGIIINKRVNQGDYINQGTIFFDVANLSRVWAMFDAYEVDLPFLNVGDKIDYTLQAIPGKTFSGRITFIDPVLDKDTRTAKVRVETTNNNLQLKPEMYANAVVKANLNQFGNDLVIPKSAVLWTGKRSIVYIKQPHMEIPTFLLREVELGPSLGDAYIVLSGLKNGEEIVFNGAFAIDASAQLEGKRSMMNNGTSKPVSDHKEHNMSDMNKKQTINN